MNQDNNSSTTVLVTVIIVVIIGAAFYFGFYARKGNVDTNSGPSVEVNLPGGNAGDSSGSGN